MYVKDILALLIKSGHQWGEILEIYQRQMRVQDDTLPHPIPSFGAGSKFVNVDAKIIFFKLH